MFVLIAGGGRTGTRLANLLINEGHKIRIIEHRPALLTRIHQELATENIVEGNATEPGILEQAGIREAHVVAAMSSEDPVNLCLCFVAKTMFEVPRTIARVNNANNAWLFDQHFRVDVALNQADVLAHLIQEEMSLGDKEVDALPLLGGVAGGHQDDGVAVAHHHRPVGLPGPSRPVSIERGCRPTVTSVLCM